MYEFGYNTIIWLIAILFCLNSYRTICRRAWHWKLEPSSCIDCALAAEKEKKPNKKNTEKKRYEIEKYASENGTAAACRKFKSKFNITESTVQSFKNKYGQMIKSAKGKNETAEKVIKEKKQGGSILLAEIDDMV